MKTALQFASNKAGLYCMLFALGLFVLSFLVNSFSVPGPVYAAVFNLKPSKFEDLSKATWILDARDQKVEFYHSLIDCNGKAVVFLKFNNKNNYPVHISWRDVLVVNSSRTRQGLNTKKELLLAPGITTPSDCSDAINKLLILLPPQIAPLAVRQMVDYSFKEVKVSKIVIN